MRIVITGGFGFLGREITDTLLRSRTLGGAPIDRLVLTDRFVPAEAPQAADPLVEVVRGDLVECLDEVFAEPVDVLIHLAAAVSAECEADFDLGMSANLDTTRALLEAARAQSASGGPTPRLVFSSSVAVYGSDPVLPLPPVVSESTLPTPRSSYGIQKLVCEQLVADYTRRGFIDGRVARLMTVSVRPGKPNAAASGFLSGIVREPLAGLPAICPVRPDLRVALASPRRTVEGILRIAEAERGSGEGRLDGGLPVNLPALTVTVAEMLATLRRVAGDAAADLVTVAPDPDIEAVVGSWPSVFDNTRAAALGLGPDPSFESVVRDYLADHPEAVLVKA
ncbi:MULTISPECIES: D-erythronate dehydrogenase [Streptomyces]|uniref:NAD-dependent epimerase/dehydratase family protein n=1 Tax=Streptomyces koelreuteriae TaxID=2838015 RepID=A0ABX8FJG8_9ACTN|nr:MULTISPECIES: D-erythronate dehydrogenase [Streptomyces]QWB21254.1 NAD-dependent epimerase/dehydratase family protein [Streptomyces koelreuteriae]UUA04171.1 NAD-dependent epimerase/dehydratase family protein [Streptomyces koelreuteriae]UUA11797.1 NAD-dependent epimerase/dehydratase family protein [Streptomyces sp. CRCS-T-1]